MAGDEKTEGYLNPNYVKEWEISRGVFDRFDGYLNDLRKYGFTLITALLALSAFLLPYSTQTDTSTGIVTTSNFPDNIKFVVLLVNLLVIVAATAIDRNYTVIIKAAASRARVLERALNLELTEIITRRYRSAHTEKVITGLYSFFMAMVLILGVFVLGHDMNLLLLLLVFVSIAIGAVVVIRTYISVEYTHGPIDYTLDRLQCTQGDTVAITLTNLENPEIIIEKDAIVWEIRGQGNTSVYPEKANRIIRIEDRDSYTWLWKDTESVEPGIYEVWRPTATKKPEPVRDGLRNELERAFGKAASAAAYTQLLKDAESKTKLVALPRRIRVYKKSPEPSQTDSDKKLEMIKELLD